MPLFRRKKNPGVYPWLLAAAVLLRSFVAPGYMLTVSAETGPGIIFCNGPVFLNAHHDQHPSHHHAAGDGKARDDIHISPVCSDWSTSGLLVISAVFETVLFDAARTASGPEYTPPLFHLFSETTRAIRAPPALV